jgi:hypothetical protein
MVRPRRGVRDRLVDVTEAESDEVVGIKVHEPEQLADLRVKDILTEEEFVSKKTELLSRV